MTSSNPRAEQVMGRRVTVGGPDIIPFDTPAELGYRCPICNNQPYDHEHDRFDDRLEWSEYNGFLWCAECDMDYPTVLCVDLHAAPDPARPWVNAGVAAAVTVYLDTVEYALARAAAHDRDPFPPSPPTVVDVQPRDGLL